MSKIVGDCQCPKCAEKGRDSTHDHLMIYKDGGSYCNRCKYAEPPGTRYEDGTMRDEEDKPVKQRRALKNAPRITLEEVEALDSDALLARGIDWDIAEEMGVKIEYSTSTGEEIAYYYPLIQDEEVVSYHCRVLPKTFERIGPSTKGKKLEMFGQSVCRKGGNKLLIVEGQDDQLAAFQML